MQSFSFSRFTFTIQGETTLFLPAYKGSTLRGGFGHAFRRIVCVFKGKECRACLLRHQCVYSWVFETPVPGGSQIIPKCKDAPHPFIIEPSAEKQKNYQTDEQISFDLVLVGRAIDHLPYFIYAFEELGRIGIGKGKGKYQLVRVTQMEEGRAGQVRPSSKESREGGQNQQPSTRVAVVYQGHDKMLAESLSPVHWPEIIDDPPRGEIRLNFLTPTRIKYEGRLTRELEFHVLVRNLLRRIFLLAYFHCGQKLDDSSFKGLIEQARQVRMVKRSLFWEDWERYSNRQQTRMKLGGFMGEAVYAGDLAPFWPYIRLGEQVHVGKGSSFGLGRYTIASQSPHIVASTT